MAQSFGVIGLAVMGENIALNVERNGFPIAVYNRSRSKTDAFMENRAGGKNVVPTFSLEEFVGALERPRRILLMVQAGKPVDMVIDSLKPLLDPDDMIIDGGNSLYEDTERRVKDLESAGFNFIGMGVSGGEEGALNGPSLMPGGSRAAYDSIEPIVTKIAAQVDDGPCVTYIGQGGSGHFVKMVHNGIEYGDMQLIAESYDLLKRVGGLTNAELADVFNDWNQGQDLESFLIDITADIFKFGQADGDDEDLIDLVRDAAKAKGTGAWTVQAAMDLGVSIPTIAEAVMARSISDRKTEREKAQDVLEGPRPREGSVDKELLIRDVRAALYCSKICSYAQGFTLLQAADMEYGFGLRIKEVAGIWRAGCIIRAAFLNDITAAISKQPDLANLLMAQQFANELAERQEAWRRVIEIAVAQGVPVPGFASSLAYYDSYRTARLPANLIQAQRDFFGAHTYERLDKPVGETFHTEWSQKQPTTDASPAEPSDKA